MLAFISGFLIVAVVMRIAHRTSHSTYFTVLILCCTGGMIVDVAYLAYGASRDRHRSRGQVSHPRYPRNPRHASGPGQADLRAARSAPTHEPPRPGQPGKPALSGCQPIPEETRMRMDQRHDARDERGALVPQASRGAPAAAAHASREPAMSRSPVDIPAGHAVAPATTRDTRDETPPALPFRAGRVADPIVFDGPSAAGQASWLLPEGNAVMPTGLAADGARLGDLEVRAATVVGADHRCGHPARPRQDAYSLDQTPDRRYLLAAVADGVSNSEHSDLGARIAASRATRELAASIAGAGCPADTADFATSIARDMAATAKGRGIHEDEVQCVLAAAAIPAQPDRNGRRRIWCAWIGDASVWLRQGEDLHRVTGEPKRGPEPNALSTTLPFHPHEMQMVIIEAEQGDSVIIMTDGLADSLDMVGGVREYFVSQWSERPPHPAAFLYSLCYDAPGQKDDRTAIVTWCGADGHRRGGRR